MKKTCFVTPDKEKIRQTILKAFDHDYSSDGPERDFLIEKLTQLSKTLEEAGDE
jgi:CRISPR/Cas system type I-B associated protein Csh2 (Cas7 group RAMP superfamily)